MIQLADKNLSLISNDIKVIEEKLGEYLVGIALFGSCCNLPLSEANDIDLAIFVKGKKVQEVRNILVKSRAKYPIKARAVNGSYGSPEPGEIIGKHYHIVVLDIDHLNKKFIDYNRGCLHFLAPTNKALHMDKFSALLQICQ